MKLPAFKVRYLRKLLNYPLGGLTIDPEEARKGLEYLGPKKRSDKAKASQGALRARKSTKIAAHRMSTKDIRAACMERAKGFCECGCGREFDGTWWNVPELDEWLGGSGRKQQKKSLQTCWMLVRWCHRQRTDNYPNAAYWNEAWRKHCLWHGYAFTPHIEHKPLSRRGTA